MPDSSSVSSRERQSRYSLSRTASRQSSQSNVLHEMELSNLSNLRVGSPMAHSVYAPIPADFLLEASQVNPRFISGRGEGSVLEDRKSISKSFQRDAKELETELQRLITSQEQALTKTTGGARPSSVNGRVRKPMTLKQIRNGLLSTMQALADTRRQEDDFYEDEMFTRTELIEKVEVWLRRRKRIERDMEKIENDSEGKQMEELQHKLDVVEGDIRLQEEELRRLRSEKSDILSEMESLSSVLSSRLSSYNASLQTISKSANEFLQSPHALLPPQRSSATMPLTPEAAIDHWKTEKHALSEKRTKISQEAEALKAGVRLWEECLVAVTGYEKFMIGKLGELQMSNSQAVSGSQIRARPGKSFSIQPLEDESSRPSSARSASSGRNTPLSAFANRPPRNTNYSHSRNGSLSSSTETYKPEKARSSPLKSQRMMPEDLSSELLHKLDPLISQMENLVSHAEERNWTLLVCCIGAELSALTEARAMLVAAGAVPEPSKPQDYNNGAGDLLGQTEPPDQTHVSGSSETETEDEIDDPALLFQSTHSFPQPRSRLDSLRTKEADELDFGPLRESGVLSSRGVSPRRHPQNGTSEEPFQPIFSTPLASQTLDPREVLPASSDDSDAEMDPAYMFMDK